MRPFRPLLPVIVLCLMPQAALAEDTITAPSPVMTPAQLALDATDTPPGGPLFMALLGLSTVLSAASSMGIGPPLLLPR